MSLQNTLAKLYLRYFIRKEEELDSLKTQKKESLPDPPKSLAHRFEKCEIDGVPAFWINKAKSANGILIYLHGSAFYFGPVKEHWGYLTRIADLTNMAGLMIDYRLSPLNPFPAGFNDILEVISNLDLNDNWFLLGDSSGAAMAVSVVFSRRDQGLSLPKKLVLMSPWIDATLENPAIELNKHLDPMMTVERLSKAAAEYTVNDDRRNALISPMFGDLKQMPPTLIQMGTADLLLWDCRKFYLKCLDAGVAVIYEEYAEAFHDFMMADFVPEGRKALRSQAAFLTSQQSIR